MITNIQVAHYAEVAAQRPEFDFALDIVLQSIPAGKQSLEVRIIHTIANTRRATSRRKWGEVESQLGQLQTLLTSGSKDGALQGLMEHIQSRRDTEETTQRSVLKVLEYLQSIILRETHNLRRPLPFLEIVWDVDYPYVPQIE